MGWGYRQSGEVRSRNRRGRRLQPDDGNRSAARGRGQTHHHAPHEQPPGEPDTGVLIRGIRELERRRSKGREFRRREESGLDRAGEQGAAGEKSEREVNAAITKDNDNNRELTLIFLGATWKYASKVENKNTELGLRPSNLIKVKLAPDREGYGGASGEINRNRDNHSSLVEGSNSDRRGVGKARQLLWPWPMCSPRATFPNASTSKPPPVPPTYPRFNSWRDVSWM